MATSLRCRISGCDLDECGICRRCGSEREAKHSWSEKERARPCFRLQVCERCGKDKEAPDHDWESSIGPTQDTQLKCTRCGLTI